VAVNIDFSTVLNTGKLDNKSKAADFTGSRANKPYSFRDSLKEAIRSRGQEERKPDNSTIRKEMLNRAESKLKSVEEPDKADNKKTVSEVEDKEKKTVKKDTTLEELLANMEELSNLRQTGDMTSDKQNLLADIKEALKELEAAVKSNSAEVQGIQTKTAGLTEILKGMQKELNENESTEGTAFADLAKQLETIVKEAPLQYEGDSGSKTNNASVKPLPVQETDNINTADNKLTEGHEAENGIKVQSTENKAGTSTESISTEEAPENQGIVTKTEASAVEVSKIKKDGQPAAEENEENLKAALDGKAEKVTVEAEKGKESKRQDAEAGTEEKATEAVHKTTAGVNSRAFTEEMNVMNQNQTAADSEAEAVQEQVQVQVPRQQTVSKAEVINQIVKKAEIVMSDAQHEMRMQLEPENLGKLTLKVAVERGLITAKFVAESYEVKQVIESSFNELKDMLQEKGLEVQNLSVSVGHDKEGYNNSNTFQQWKETVRLNARSISRGGSYGDHQESEGTPRIINPYSVHNGRFDHRA